MKLRSITVFAEIRTEVDSGLLRSLGEFAREARGRFEDAGYPVQTVRLATDSFPSLAASPWANHPEDWATETEQACTRVGFEYISLGPAGPEMRCHIPGILRATQAIFATTHLLDPGVGVIDGRAIRDAAQIIRECAEIEAGFGNLRFGALANVQPGVPFFPAAYHGGGQPAFALATEAADLAVDACEEAGNAQEANNLLVAAIERHAAELVPVAEGLSSAHGLRFDGLDFSLAPFPAPEISIGAALERLSGVPLGQAGTLAAAATLTDAIGRASFPYVGFCGLMLPVLEDGVLAQRSAEGRLSVGELLQWSAVCGTGLDTVPLPGDVSTEALERLLYDVAGLSARLRKPLTARLMPLPGKSAGDPVHFDFAYFCDGGVLPLEPGTEEGLLSRCGQLALAPRRQDG